MREITFNQNLLVSKNAKATHVIYDRKTDTLLCGKCMSRVTIKEYVCKNCDVTVDWNMIIKVSGGVENEILITL